MEHIRTFNEECYCWTNKRAYNIIYLKSLERYFNDRLKIYGYIFLKEVFDELGLTVTNNILKSGWIYGKNIVKFEFVSRGNNPNIRIVFHTIEDITKEA